MKARFDRCCGSIHCQSWRGKYGVAVVTSGGDASAEVEAYMLRSLAAVGCWTVGSVGASGAQVFSPTGLADRVQAAADLGRTLAEAIRQKRAYPEQEPKIQAFAGYMRQLCALQRERWPFEYEYWQKRTA